MDPRLLKRLNVKDCPKHLDERTAAFAEGAITDETQRLEVMRHLLECDSCRYLLDDFFLMSIRDSEEKEEFAPAGAEILLSMKSGVLKPLSAERLNLTLVPVMSSSENSVVEYTIPMGDRDMLFRVNGAGGYISFELEKTKPGSTYHLIGGPGFQSVRASGSVVTFERVTPGNYLITEDMKGYISVKMEE